MAPTAEGSEFVRAVMREMRATSAGDLATAMGWPRGKESLVAKWLRDEHRPSFPNMMEMMEKCGWLSQEAAAASTAEQSTLRSSPHDLLEEIAATVKVNSESLAELLLHFELPVPDKAPSQARDGRDAAPPTDQETTG